MNLKEQLLKIKEMVISFKKSGSMEKTFGTNEGNIRGVTSGFTEEDAELSVDRIIKLQEKRNSPVADKISNHFRSVRNISLDSKVDNFIDWYTRNMVKGHYTKIGEYKKPIELRNLIEKMAVWYELRYPEYEISKLMPGSSHEDLEVSDIMFNKNNYINESLDENSLVRILEWDEFYNTNTFINSLPWEERRFFEKPKYDNIVYLNPIHYSTSIMTHFHLSLDGFVEKSEGVGVYTNYQITDNEVEGMHVKEVLK